MYRNASNYTYQVQAGDTLYSVARRNSITPAQLMQANPQVNPYHVPIGATLKIPSAFAGKPASPSALSASAPVQALAAPGVMPKQTDAILPPVAAQSALRDEMRTLWEQHVWWTRELIISITSGLPDESDVTKRLLQNPVQIAALFEPAFGVTAANEVARLLTEHLMIGGELIHAAQDGDAAAYEDADRRWYENADAIAAALGSLGYDEPEMRAMLNRHLDLTKACK